MIPHTLSIILGCYFGLGCLANIYAIQKGFLSDVIKETQELADNNYTPKYTALLILAVFINMWLWPLYLFKSRYYK